MWHTLRVCADALPADGLNAATEWRDIVQEAAKGMIILVLLETLMITRDSSWLEVRLSCKRAVFARVRTTHFVCDAVPPQDHVDYLACQALMFGRASSNLLIQAKLIFIRSRRLG